MVFKLIVRVLCALSLMMFLDVFAVAQTYPTKPVRLIVAQAAGGASDILIRPVAQKLGDGGSITGYLFILLGTTCFAITQALNRMLRAEAGWPV